MRDDHTWVDPPRWLRRLAVGSVVLALLMLYGGAWHTGVAWDETYHVMRMRSWLEHGWYLLPNELQDARPAPWLSDSYYLVYAPVTMVLLHGLALLAGVDADGVVSASAGAFAVRHLGVATIGVIGLAAVYGLATLVARAWAPVAVALCAAVGLWTGSAMFNIKDVPVATGYTVFTLGVALVATRRTSPWRAAALVALGVTLAMGTRPGIWPGLLAVLVLALALRPSWRVLTTITAGIAIAWLVLIAVYPVIFAHPLSLLGSLGESAHFRGATSPWWYVPRQLLGEIPSLMLVLAVIGAVWAVRAFVRARGRPDTSVFVLWLVAVQALALPVVAMLGSSHLYNGLRQLLFLVPALSVLAAAGAANVLTWSQRRTGALRRLGGALTAATLLLPTASQALLWPYNYAYESPVGMVLSGGDDTDWWRTSVRELSPSLPATARIVCSPLTREGQWRPYAAESHEDCASALVGPLAPYADDRAGQARVGEFEFVGVQSGRSSLGPGCRRLSSVERWVNWSREVMSTAGVCPMNLSRYPFGGLSFVPPANTGEFELGVFADAHDERGKALTEDSVLGLVSPVEPDSDVQVQITLDGDEAASATVNGTAIALSRAAPGESPADRPGAWQGTIPASLIGDGRMLVRLGPPGARIRSLYLADTTKPEESQP